MQNRNKIYLANKPNHAPHPTKNRYAVFGRVSLALDFQEAYSACSQKKNYLMQ